MLQEKVVATPPARGFLLPAVPTTRTCRSCRFIGPEVLFARSVRKYTNLCKCCDAARQRKRDAEKREEILEARREAYKANPEVFRERGRKRYRRDLEGNRRRGREHARTARGREQNRAAVARYKSKHPERVKARHLVKLALQRGDLTKPKRCQVKGCKYAGPLHGHHSNYSKPLVVDFLCNLHHEHVHHEGPVRLKKKCRAKIRSSASEAG
jgi:hypothetical protein